MGFRYRIKNEFGLNKYENSSDETDLSKIRLSFEDVLFVCNSNTVVSPIAEAIFNQFSGDRQAFSAGLNAQSGNSASEDAITVCQEHGIELSDHVTANINDFFLDDVRLVLTSTAHIRDTLKIRFPNAKIFTIKEYAGGYFDSDIFDPLTGGLAGYEACFMEINEAVIKIIRKDMGAEAEEIVERPAVIWDESIPDADVLSDGRLIVVSGLNGNLEYYNQYLSLWNKNDSDCHIVFLGNLIYSIEDDDGSLEILDDAIEKSEKYPNFHYLLGINELSCIMGEDIYKMGINLKTKFEDLIVSKKGSLEPYLGEYVDFLKKLTYFLKTENGLFLSYSGPSATVKSLEDISSDLNLLHDFLWARKGEYESGDVEEFLDALGLKLMVVGNMPCDDGYDVFSRQLIISSGDSGENQSYLDIDLGEDMDMMDDLVGCLKSIDGIFKVEENSVSVGKEVVEKSNAIKNFKYLEDLIHSGAKEIVLDADIVLEDGEKYEYEEGIKIDVDSLIIEGMGHTIDAMGETQIFFVSSSSNVTVKNVNFTNGQSNDFGGAIYNTGKLTIIKSLFSNNNAGYGEYYGGGGAIYNDGGAVLNIFQSSFINNSTEYGGGAICSRGELKVTKSEFNGNESNGDGGAIVDDGILMMNNCEISSNSSPYDIISITKYSQIHTTLFKCNSAPIILSNHRAKSNFGIFYSKFIENEVERAIISNGGRYGVIDGTTFKNNRFIDNSRNIVNKSDLTLINIRIDEEKSILNDGHILIKKSLQDFRDIIDGEGEFVIYENMIPKEDKFDFGHLDNEIHESTSKEIILSHDITFGSYERDFYEGGIELDIDGLVIDGKGKTIDARGISRIFIITGRNIMLKNIVFKNGYFFESAEFQLKIGGGALKIEQNSDLTIENCKFINNASEDKYGVIDNAGHVTVIGSLFANNRAHDCAGVIYNRGWMDIDESSLKDNTADNRGGALYNEGVLTISQSIFTNNKSKRNGGVVYNKGILTIKKSKLMHNSVNKKGGGIYNKAKLVMSDVVFEGNVSGYDGGGLYNNGELYISESVFKSNKSRFDGGGLFNKGKLSASSSVFQTNVSDNGGGAIYNMSESGLRGVKFIENVSQGGGGAIYNMSESGLRGVKFIENVSQGGGGAICNSDKLDIVDSDFNENASDTVGGAICSYGDDLSIINSNFNDNNVKKLGGAIFNLKGQLNIMKSKFIDNGANMEGGAIYNDEAQLVMKETVIIGNSSKESGGAIFNHEGEMYISDSTIKSNIAVVGGGAIVNTAELNMSKSSLTHNQTRGIGGAIVNTSHMTISESSISHNCAIHMAGAIDNYKGELIISESVFTGNEVKWDGGATMYESIFDRDEWNGSGIIYNDGGKLRVFGSSFAENIMRWGESGMILSNNSDYEVDYCNFENTHPDVVECMDESDIGWEAGDASSISDDAENMYLDLDVISDGGEETECLDVEDEIADDDVVFDSIPDDDSDWRREDYLPDDIMIGFGFKDLDGLVHSGRDKIVLDTDVCLKRDNESEYLNGIKLDVDDLVIDGNGHTIDACGKVRIFQCCGKNITIMNIRLRNGFADDGGAVFNDGGNLTIIRSDLVNNSARNGGAIRNLRGTLNILESEISNNNASSSGGAISNSDILNIEVSAIKQNTAGSGGGIGNGGKLTIKNSLLKQNKAESRYGGAIDNSEELTIIDSELTGNFAERDGGAIHNNCADLLLMGSSFSGNRANENGDAIFNYRENSFKSENCDLDFWDVKKYNEYDGD